MREGSFAILLQYWDNVPGFTLTHVDWNATLVGQSAQTRPCSWFWEETIRTCIPVNAGDKQGVETCPTRT